MFNERRSPTVFTDKISKIWDEIRTKLGCSEDKVWK
jgi:hypothetical protein